jgi:uncharacterized protein (TIGR02466 family)
MSLKVAYFAPTIMAIDDIPPGVFSQIYNLSETLHSHPELNDAGNPQISIRGGQQIQVYPNELQLDVSWLVKYIEEVCTGYMELVSAQSGTEELKYCKPVVTSIWTIRQGPGQYQEMHCHPGGNLSGNIYIQVPELEPNSLPSDGQVLFRMSQSKDITRFIMNDTWKFSPQQGAIILFPSHIPHTVYPWKGTGYRTVMAFDAVLRPKDE